MFFNLYTWNARDLERASLTTLSFGYQDILRGICTRLVLLFWNCRELFSKRQRLEFKSHCYCMKIITSWSVGGWHLSLCAGRVWTLVVLIFFVGLPIDFTSFQNRCSGLPNSDTSSIIIIYSCIYIYMYSIHNGTPWPRWFTFHFAALQLYSLFFPETL